jgi:hypothetical protein
MQPAPLACIVGHSPFWFPDERSQASPNGLGVSRPSENPKVDLHFATREDLSGLSTTSHNPFDERVGLFSPFELSLPRS